MRKTFSLILALLEVFRVFFYKLLIFESFLVGEKLIEEIKLIRIIFRSVCVIPLSLIIKLFFLYRDIIRLIIIRLGSIILEFIIIELALILFRFLIHFLVAFDDITRKSIFIA